MKDMLMMTCDEVKSSEMGANLRGILSGENRWILFDHKML